MMRVEGWACGLRLRPGELRTVSLNNEQLGLTKLVVK
jgi:hypothetical protein